MSINIVTTMELLFQGIRVVRERVVGQTECSSLKEPLIFFCWDSLLAK